MKRQLKRQVGSEKDWGILTIGRDPSFPRILALQMEEA